MNPEEVNWEEARKVVRIEKPNWYEDFDEAEGEFMGWRYKKSHNAVSFKKFIKWWEQREEFEIEVPKSQTESSHADYYREGSNGRLWKEDPYSYGCLSIDVLEFLWGQPWNDIALNYVYSLRPTVVRIVKGGCYTDARIWRVTVWLEKDNITIKKIEQEVQVGMYGVICGHDLNMRLKKQKEESE